MASLIGSKIERKEDKRFLTGKGQYTADINLVNQTYASFVRSPHARAQITKVDITKANKAPGVVKILTGDDLATDKIGGLIAGWKIVSQDGKDMKVPPHPPLAKDSVNYVGDHVAIVIAETLEQAKNATELVNVSYKLKKAVDAGKIRYVGLSNENPWGIMKFLEYSKIGLPKMITIQNPYSLLNRLFEIGSGEICKRENVGLLAYSPLGFGFLTGKYRNNNIPKNSRLDLFPNMSRYNNENCKNAIELYNNIAEENNLTLTQLALAFVNDRPFVTSNIIGATTMEQLKENIDSINTKLSRETLDEIDKAQEKIPNPAP